MNGIEFSIRQVFGLMPCPPKDKYLSGVEENVVVFPGKLKYFN
jgi:hypothetical protein